MAAKRQRAPRHRSEPDAQALTIGAKVRELRRERDFTFDAFVEETGLGRGYVSELERGLVVPGVAVLAKIARALEVPIADLVLGETERERLFDDTRHLPAGAVKRLREQVAALRLRYRVTEPPQLEAAEPRRGKPKKR